MYINCTNGTTKWNVLQIFEFNSHSKKLQLCFKLTVDLNSSQNICLQSRFTRLRSIYFMHQCLHIWFCYIFLTSFIHSQNDYISPCPLTNHSPILLLFLSSWFGFGIGFSARDILDSINLIGIWYFVWKF